jgi:septal ring factor EnvC (AmiA/AmiB activator)
MNIDEIHLAVRSTAEGAQKILHELEAELTEVKARRDKILVDISKANDASVRDQRARMELPALNKQDAETGRLIRSIERQIVEARKRIAMAEDHAAVGRAKRASVEAVMGDRLFEVETPDGRRVRHRYSSADGLQKMLQPNYRVVAEVFGAGIDGKGGMVEALGHSTMKTLLSVHGDELLAFLAERGIVGSIAQAPELAALNFEAGNKGSTQ